jgi:hypothetical protein
MLTPTGRSSMLPVGAGTRLRFTAVDANDVTMLTRILVTVVFD